VKTHPSVICAGVMFVLASCATVSTERVRADYETADVIQPFPPYEGPKIPIQVVRFGIPEGIVAKYPELADKRVGWGLSNRIVEGFYNTHRFEFIEEKESIIKRMLDQWSLTEAGIYYNGEKDVPEGLKAPEYLIYAEVYEFSVSHSEVLVGVAAEMQNTTIMGIQLRMVNVATGEYIPASGIGEATTTAAGVWVNPNLPFDQSTVGIASHRAVNVAIRNLLKRLDYLPGG